MHLEEGEIIDDEEPFLEYSPLERPIEIGHQQQSTATISYSSDSSSDEDGSCHKLPKRPKVVAVPNKYNVWVMSENQEDLALSMNLCGMDSIKDRSVEYYPYKLASTSGRYNFNSFSAPDNEEDNDCQSKPGSATDHFHRKMIYKKRKKMVHQHEDFQREGRELHPLQVNHCDPPDEVASEIADKLAETNRNLILQSVVVLGNQKAIEFFEKTRVIEREGGLLINNQSRKRTPGGVYLFLIRQDRSISPQSMREIFNDLRDKKEAAPHRKSLKRKKAKQKEILKQSDAVLENEELENPPPSPATEGDALPFIKASNVHLEDPMETL